MYSLGSGSVTLAACLVSENSASSSGGGISRADDSAPIAIYGSTIAANSAPVAGGLDLNGAATLENVTVSGNANEGIRFRGKSLSVVNSTVTANSTAGIRGYQQKADGIHLANSILAGNPSADLVAIALDAASNHNLIGGDPKLGKLADNGGPTWTHLPLPGSPAIDTGSDTDALLVALTTDQRGAPRFSGVVDIGAVEVQAPSITAVDLGTGGLQRSSLRGPFRITAQAGDGQVQPLQAASVTLVRLEDGRAFPLYQLDATTLEDEMSITLGLAGAGLEGGSLPDGHYQLRVNGHEVRDPTYGMTMNGDYTTEFHRFFGDSNGDGLVDARDYLAFRAAYLSGTVNATNWYFDADGDGRFTMADLTAFNDRFRKRRLS